jgi:hypothetical protein
LLARKLAASLALFALAGLVPAPAEAAVGRWSSQGPPGGPVNAIALSPAATNVVWAGTVDVLSGEPKPGHLSKSTDGGRTWGSVRALSFTPIGTIAADPVDPGVALVGTPSTQGGGRPPAPPTAVPPGTPPTWRAG